MNPQRYLEMSLDVTMEIHDLLCRRINKPEIKRVISWALECPQNSNAIYELTKSPDERLSVNALWCLSHMPEAKAGWMQSLQNELIDRLLVETHPSKKRILFSILRGLSYDKDNIRTDFLDYCFSKINSECEPCAVRSFSIYCAFKLSRFYPELIAELEQYLDMLPVRSLSPGLRCALRTTRLNISQLDFN